MGKGTEKLKSEVKAQQTAFKEQMKKREEMFQVICAMPEGIELLREIMQRSGFINKNVVTSTDMSIDPYSMVYNEGRRSIYLELRNGIPKSAISKIENGGTL